MKIRKSIPLALLICLSAVACNKYGEDSSFLEFGGRAVTYAGSRSILVANQIDPVNLPLLISS